MFLFGLFCHAHGHTQGAWLAWWMCVPTKIYKERWIQVNATFAFWYSWYTSWAITVCRHPIKEICTASEVGSRTKKFSDSCVEIFECVHSLHFGRYSIVAFVCARWFVDILEIQVCFSEPSLYMQSATICILSWMCAQMFMPICACESSMPCRYCSNVHPHNYLSAIVTDFSHHRKPNCFWHGVMNSVRWLMSHPIIQSVLMW